jgi:4-alpha-glucanotransferase
VIVPLQDVFGWRDRVNTPAVVSHRNWSWRLPWPVDELMTSPEARERAAFLGGIAKTPKIPKICQK